MTTVGKKHNKQSIFDCKEHLLIKETTLLRGNFDTNNKNEDAMIFTARIKINNNDVPSLVSLKLVGFKTRFPWRHWTMLLPVLYSVDTTEL